MAFVVAVASQKGGAGKSTVAANLATALLAEGIPVALLDTDPQGTLSRWHQERPE
ncbi:ParA family protein, partial [Roseomonas sp. DSM 102946]|nr:ParA family protein [Roseomonas sp. DSM 102946]